VVVNHYTNTDKLIPAIPGFRTSAGESFWHCLQNLFVVSCAAWLKSRLSQPRLFATKLFPRVCKTVLTNGMQLFSRRSAQTFE
jgi:hypothetical protein